MAACCSAELPSRDTQVNIEIVTIGDELLLGLTIDTNAAWLARELSTVGVSIVRRATCGDDAADIARAVSEALERTGAVITTGGLGPTADDLTKEAIAGLFGRAMEFHAPSWERIREIWRTRGRPGEVPESNKQQVMLPAGCEVLTNRHGTAPGMLLEDAQGRWVAMLPGVPREMRGIFRDELGPRIRARGGNSSFPILTRTVRTTGIAESSLADRLVPHQAALLGLSLAYLPGQEGVDLRLTSRGQAAEAAERGFERGVAVLREAAGEHAYGMDATDLADVVLTLSRTAGYTMAVAESCTGGMLGARLTAIPGASDVFLGGVIAYDNAVKIAALGVDVPLIERHGAVSEEVAIAMAKGACDRFGAAIGIGITGVAGPGGGSVEKPVGLVYVAAQVDGAMSIRGGQLIGDREEVRFRATQVALDLVRRSLGG